MWVRVGPALTPASIRQLSLRQEHPVLVLFTTGPLAPRLDRTMAVPTAWPDHHVRSVSVLDAIDAPGGQAWAASATRGEVPVLARVHRWGPDTTTDAPLRWAVGATHRTVERCNVAGLPPSGGARPQSSTGGTIEVAILALHQRSPEAASAAREADGGARPRNPTGATASAPSLAPWPVMLDDCHVRDLFSHPACGRWLGGRGTSAYALVAAAVVALMLLVIGASVSRSTMATAAKTHPD